MTARAGMTLIEVVVALSIAGMAIAAGYGALASVVDHRGRLGAAAAADIRHAAIRRTVIEWLSSARLLTDEPGVTFRGLDGTRDLADDELIFLTVAGFARERSRVRLYVDHDEATPERGFTAEVTLWPQGTTRRVELEPRAVGLDIRYYSRLMRAPEWLPSWISSSVLPAGIELRLVALPADTLPLLLALPMLVSLGSGR